MGTGGLGELIEDNGIGGGTNSGRLVRGDGRGKEDYQGKEVEKGHHMDYGECVVVVGVWRLQRATRDYE